MTDEEILEAAKKIKERQNNLIRWGNFERASLFIVEWYIENKKDRSTRHGDTTPQRIKVTREDVEDIVRRKLGLV